MLLDDFYKIKQQWLDDREKNMTDYQILLNEKHSIFASHFPNNPIVPGVYILQIGKELFSITINKNLFIKTIKNIKFLNPINPTINPLINFKLTWEGKKYDGLYPLKIIVYYKEIIFAKINMQLNNIIHKH